jgi:2-C-methyl-D-erythritol 4-phosphate cytidylyltransferase
VRTAAILLAGGSGTRLRNSENKVYLPIGGKALLCWSLDLFGSSPLIDDIVLVIRASDAAQVSRLQSSPPAKLRTIVEGGATRHASEQAGLDAIAGAIEGGSVGLVLIHDAARPFVSTDLLERIVETAARAGGAVPSLPLETPVFRSTGRLEQVGVSHLRRVQTPQAFWARELLAAYRAAAEDGFAGVDTAESVQRYSDLEIKVVEGDQRNIKVTFVEDLFAAEELARTWPNGER